VYQEFYKMLFLCSEKNPPIEEQLYLFMKRFHTQPSEFFAMEWNLRRNIFFKELELLEKEYEQHKKAAGEATETENKQIRKSR
jgi:hypothetical protein